MSKSAWQWPIMEAHEGGDINPPITDSAMFAFESAQAMSETFAGEGAPHFLYGRHSNASTVALGRVLAELEGAEAAHPTASGISAIACTLLHLCSAGDEIVASHTVYGGTFALLQQVLPRFGIKTTFVDSNDLEAVRAAMTPQTKVVYAETLSNPMLALADIPALATIAHERGAQLVIDNTFTPALVQPLALGADVVVHSLTKFANGASDGLAGAICGSAEMIEAMKAVGNGTAMLLGPVLDATRAASVHKNLQTLAVRMEKHGRNAHAVASALESVGVDVCYPGLESHPGHGQCQTTFRPGMGFGGMMTINAGTPEAADRMMACLCAENVGYLAVSLGHYRTLFCAPARSTSSEIPEEDRAKGLDNSLIRVSVGIDFDAEALAAKFVHCAKQAGLVKSAAA